MMTGQRWTYTSMAHGLPNDQYVLDEENRCRFGNFANVPTTGCVN